MDLNKIVIQKTIIEISCPHCGGNLKPVVKRLLLGHLLHLLSLKKLKPKSYQCTVCKK